MTGRVLLVDDDAAVREALAQTLELADLEAITAGSFVAAKDQITAGFDGVILSDIRMPGRDGFFLLDYAHAQDADLPVILLTGEGDIPMAVKAMGQGAFGFLEKPCAPSDLVAVLERALKTRKMVLDNRRMRHLVETGDPAARMLFGVSDLAEGLRKRVRLVAQAEGAALVTGAPGTGISKIAEVVHLSSTRSKAPFVKRAAAGLTAEGLASALQEGAGGSVFIDEITRLSPQLQLTLAEALDASTDARLIAGSTQALAGLVAEGRFNADLAFYLDVLVVRIPSLAERPEDIPVMFRQYVDQAAEQAGLTAPEVTPAVVADLMARDWPGNARGLMNHAMRYAMGLPDDAAGGIAQAGLAERMRAVERAILIETLSDNKNRTVGDVRHALTKNGGNLGASGCVAYLFEKRGMIGFEGEGLDGDAIMEAALEAGAEDVVEGENGFEVVTGPSEFHAVQEALSGAGFTPNSAEITMEPSTTVKLEGKEAEQMLRLADTLEDLDDVQNFYANFDIAEEELEKFA